MTIDALPTFSSSAPVPTEPATFDPRMDAFIADLFTLVPAFNTSVGQFNTDAATVSTNATAAANSATAAAAAANFQGAWSSATGSKAAGLSFSHNGSVWALIVAAADITATEPSISNSDWSLLSAPDINAFNRTASGAWAEGDVLVANADGTVSPVTTTAITQTNSGSNTDLKSGAGSDSTVMVYHEAEDVVVGFYIVSNVLYCKVGSLSGESITWGSEQTIRAASIYHCRAVYLRNCEKIVVTYSTNSPAYFAAKVLTVDGAAKTVSAGAESSAIAADTGYTSNDTSQLVVGDHDNDKVVQIQNSDSTNSSYMTCYVGTVSGTTISFGSGVTAMAYGGSDLHHFTLTNEYGAIMCWGTSDASNHIDYNIGVISGTTINFEGQVAYDGDATTSNLYYGGGSWSDPSTKVAQSLLVWYQSGAYGLAVTWNGNTPTIGAKTAGNYVIGATAAYNIFAGAWTVSGYDGATGHWYIHPVDNAWQSTTISFGTKVAIAAYTAPQTWGGACFHYTGKRSICSNEVSTDGITYTVWRDDFNDTDIDKFIGFADAATADTETGGVNGFSQINDDQSGLTVGQKYWFDHDGSLATSQVSPLYPYAGKAISSTEIQVGST